jgi:hypothetical protein
MLIYLEANLHPEGVKPSNLAPNRLSLPGSPIRQRGTSGTTALPEDTAPMLSPIEDRARNKLGLVRRASSGGLCFIPHLLDSVLDATGARLFRLRFVDQSAVFFAMGITEIFELA